MAVFSHGIRGGERTNRLVQERAEGVAESDGDVHSPISGQGEEIKGYWEVAGLAIQER